MLTEFEERFLDILETGLDGKEKDAYLAADMMVNNFSFHRLSVINEIMASENKKTQMDAIVNAWINLFGTEEMQRFTDPRNWYSVKTALELRQNDVQNLFEGSDAAVRFTDRWRNAHRTLQQTFAGMVFEYANGRHPEIGDIFKGDDRWYRCPFI